MAKYDDKVDGNSVDATEYNQLVRPLKNMITTGGQSVVDAQNNQMGKSVTNYCSAADYYTASGTANAIVLSSVGSFNSPTVYTTGFQGRFKAGSTNTATSTVNISGIGVKTLKKINGSGTKANLVGYEIIQNRYYKVVYDGTDFIVFEDTLSILNKQRDLNISATNGSTPNDEIDITADYITVYDANSSSIVLASVSETADITISGVGGLDTGSRTVSTWYYYYIIYNPSTAATSSIFSTSSSSPTLPTGYTFFRRVGAVRNNASDVLKKFTQTDDLVVYEYAFGAESPDYRVDSNSLYGSGNVTVSVSAFYPNSIAYEMGLFITAVGNSTQQLYYQVGLDGFSSNTRLARLQAYSISSGTLRLDGDISFYCEGNSFDRAVSTTGGSFGSYGADIIWYKIKL